MSWKDSPGIVAIASGSAATAFVVTICFTVVIPTWLKSKEFEIERLNRKIGGLQEVVEQKARKISELESSFEKKEHAYSQELINLKSSIDALEKSNKKLSLDNIFSVEDVYPKGYRMVRIFDPVSRINEVYKEGEKEIEKLDSWVRVDVDGHLVREVVYYYTNYKGVETITHILFILSEENASKEFIYEMLVEKFGGKSAKFVDKNKRKEWHFNNVLNHSLEVGDGIYVIRPDFDK